MDFSRSLAKSKWNPPLLFFFICLLRLHPSSTAVEILSKSKLERCVKTSNSDNLNCEEKVVINMVVPSGSSGGEASIVAELVEVEENDTLKMQTIRVPPIITINKSAAYALYDLSYLRDVAYKPEEFYAITRKCEPDASSSVVKICERLRDQDGHIIENTEPICCPCGPRRRIPSSCGNIFDKLLKGKPNTAHCLRFPGDRSPGKILSINVPTFEALTQFGTAVVTTKNIGKLEASYSLTFDCLKGVSYMEEQFYIMKADEVVSRSFHIYPTTDQAGKYECAAILKASDFTEVDRAGCQFTTTATVLDNGSQIMSEYESKGGGLNGFFQSIKSGWKRMWDGLINFFTGKTCSENSKLETERYMAHICAGDA